MMNPEELRAVLGAATPAELHALEHAHWRYMTLIGSVSGVVTAEVAASDRDAFRHYAREPGSQNAFSEEDCTAFMVAITGLASTLCDAWADHDFYSLHGVIDNESVANSPIQC
ncbi:hypothetical protein H8F21_15960 [Pseudomonas sp. P66]|uniref:Uncharacterized protein n=2 Tax=Pseudomonas arcuscaelestis TaxID=2710591 RepID=A0ABS2C1W8_9PSED|nr:hypothetical protein [Pseudomonas arcuscaelestis]